MGAGEQRRDTENRVRQTGAWDFWPFPRWTERRKEFLAQVSPECQSREQRVGSSEMCGLNSVCSW